MGYYYKVNKIKNKFKMNLENTVNKMRKYKPLKKMNLSKVKGEILKVMKYIENPLSAGFQQYKVHNVPVNGVIYRVADAKIPNRFANQSGRGNLRYLLDKMNDPALKGEVSRIKKC